MESFRLMPVEGSVPTTVLAGGKDWLEGFEFWRFLSPSLDVIDLGPVGTFAERAPVLDEFAFVRDDESDEYAEELGGGPCLYDDEL